MPCYPEVVNWRQSPRNTGSSERRHVRSSGRQDVIAQRNQAVRQRHCLGLGGNGYGNWLRSLHKNRVRLEFSPSSASGYANLPPKHFSTRCESELREALRVAPVQNARNRQPRSNPPTPTFAEPGATSCSRCLICTDPMSCSPTSAV
jgi:hypothetical protein